MGKKEKKKKELTYVREGETNCHPPNEDCIGERNMLKFFILIPPLQQQQQEQRYR